MARIATDIALDGVLLLNKSTGISSNRALQACKRLYNARKAGHAGTLDPLASGLLPICFGRATRLTQQWLAADKRYRATLHLGTTTTTGDAEGETLEIRPVAVDACQIEQALIRFTGRIEQIPPMYSALKHQGRALYHYARAGIEIPRAPRVVTIHSLDLLGWEGEQLVLDIRCSKGTYIRTLAEDIGAVLGCGAYLSALCRTETAGFTLVEAIALSDLEQLSTEARQACLLPLSRWTSEPAWTLE